jgi:branched-chain amino acid transport system permease protein
MTTPLPRRNRDADDAPNPAESGHGADDLGLVQQDRAADDDGFDSTHETRESRQPDVGGTALRRSRIAGFALRSTALRHTALAALALLGLYILTTNVSAFRDFQIAQIAALACAAGGLTVLTGLSGQISLGQGAFMAIGAYTAALLLIHLSWPLVAVILAAGVIAAATGLIVGIAAARLRGPYLAGATLAFAVGLPELADYSHLSGSLGGANGLTVPPVTPPSGLGDTFPVERWEAWIACLTAVVTFWLLANLTRSRVGRHYRAVRDDEVAAALGGLRVASVQISAFTVAAASAGIGGALLAIVTTAAAPGAFTLALSLQLLTAVVLGGLGSLIGAALGSALLILLPVWLSDATTKANLSHNVSANLPLAVYGAALIVVMLAFPRGLAGAFRALFGWISEARAGEPP